MSTIFKLVFIFYITESKTKAEICGDLTRGEHNVMGRFWHNTPTWISFCLFNMERHSLYRFYQYTNYMLWTNRRSTVFSVVSTLGYDNYNFRHLYACARCVTSSRLVAVEWSPPVGQLSCCVVSQGPSRHVGERESGTCPAAERQRQPGDTTAQTACWEQSDGRVGGSVGRRGQGKSCGPAGTRRGYGVQMSGWLFSPCCTHLPVFS